MRGIRDWGLGIGKGRTEENANCKMQIANCKLSAALHSPLSTLHSAGNFQFSIFNFQSVARNPRPGRRALRSNPQSLIPNPSRSGLSLLEVLVSIGILTIGLVGLAMLIPAGKLQLVATNKSDRTGACGRAGMREVKVRRMLDATGWSTSPASLQRFCHRPNRDGGRTADDLG